MSSGTTFFLLKPGCLVIPGPHPFQEELSIWHFAQGAWPGLTLGEMHLLRFCRRSRLWVPWGWGQPRTGQF